MLSELHDSNLDPIGALSLPAGAYNTSYDCNPGLSSHYTKKCRC